MKVTGTNHENYAFTVGRCHLASHIVTKWPEIHLGGPALGLPGLEFSG